MGRGLSYVCISLTGSTARREMMVKQFEQRGIVARFFDAHEVLGPVENVPGYDAKGRNRRYGWPLKKGEVGCYLSHRAVWRELIESGDEAWCVMEDDIALADGFKTTTAELFDAREHWDVVRLFGLNKRPQRAYAVLPGDARIMWMDRHPVGCQCYVITRDAAARLLAYTARIVHPIDVALDRNWEHGLRLFITSPEFVSEAGLPSTIADEGHKQNLSGRLKAKLYRRIDKCSAALYNVRNRPTRPLMLSTGAQPRRKEVLQANGASKRITPMR